MRNLLKFLLKVIYGVLISIFTIGISTIITLNSKFIYYYAIDKYNLTNIGQISKEMLKRDFSTLINYLQNPFIKELNFNNFPMSTSGEIHFYEVKEIFLGIYISTILIALLFIILFIIYKLINKNMYFYKILNYGANTLICTIVALLSAMYIDFSKAFIIFHKIFFDNNYWLFDERTDPIIRVLPEEVFMIYALFIVTIVVIMIIIYKIYYYRNYKKYR